MPLAPMALMHRASINDLSTLMYRAGNTALAIDGDRSVLLLRHVMRRLQRTAWRQRFLHDASIALFAGLLVAAVSVLLVRLSAADIAPRMVVIVTLVTSLAAALIITIVKRPSAMQVAIRADLALGLKQQFSTAWEFVADGRDPEVTLRLARAASSTRLAHQAGSAFPLHWPAPAKFIPVALIALMMTFVVELPADQAGVLSSDESAPGARALEPEVLRLGEQLRDFAQRMRQRAERDGLPRSQQIADELERLGQRMQEGTLNRERAITELKFATDAIDREYEAALTQGASVDAGIMTGTHSFQSLRRTAGLPDLERLSRRLARGELTEQDVQKLSENADTLMSLGVDSEQLADALREHQAGDSRKLQELLRQAQENAQLRADAAELARANQELAQSREQLDDSSSGAYRRPTQPGPQADGAGEGDDLFGDEGREESSEAFLDGMDQGSGIGNQAPSGRSRERPEIGMPAITTAVRPRGQADDGRVFNSQIRTLPRSNSVKRTGEGTLAREYQSEFEQVMSRDDVPAHRKQFVREYFLTLTRGAPGEGMSEPRRR